MPASDQQPEALTLEELQNQLRQMRALLSGLQLQTRKAVSEGGEDMAQFLIDANEQLVLSALNAQAEARTAISKLDQLARSSQRDALTDTPNRALLLDRIESALTMAQRRSTRAAVLFIDIDHFKEINDSLGHAAGDAVLKRVALRLQAAVRDSDAVGRHGGDEFVVLLAEVARLTDPAHIAKKIIADIAAPSLVNGNMLHVGVSVGIAIFPDDAQDPSSLICQADSAMYRSKRRGGACYSFFGDIPMHYGADGSEGVSG